MEVTEKIRSLWDRFKGTPWLDEAVGRMNGAADELRAAMVHPPRQAPEKERKALNGRDESASSSR